MTFIACLDIIKYYFRDYYEKQKRLWWAMWLSKEKNFTIKDHAC